MYHTRIWRRCRIQISQVCVTSHTWMSHVTHINESCHTYECTTCEYWGDVRSGRFKLSRVTHNSCVTWRIHVCDMSRVTCHTHECVMSHIWMGHNTHTNVPTRIWRRCQIQINHVCVMSHTWMSHITYINESCHTYECTTREYGGDVESNGWCHTHEWVMSRVWMNHNTHTNVLHANTQVVSNLNKLRLCHVTHMDESCYTYECTTCEYGSDTGWQRPIRCLKLQVIFRKRATHYRALLRKMTYKDKASYGSSPPCIRLGRFEVCHVTHLSHI